MLIAATALTLVLAVAIAVWASGDDPGPPGTVVTLQDLSAGDSDVLAGGRQQVGAGTPSPKEWEALLPRLKEAAADADPAALRRLALAYYNLGSLEGAQDIYEQLLAQGEDAVVRNRLGNVLRDRGDLVGAEAAYRQAIGTDPALPAAYLNLAQLLWRLHRDDEALQVLERGRGAVNEAARPVIDRAIAVLEAPPGSAPASTTTSGP